MTSGKKPPGSLTVLYLGTVRSQQEGDPRTHVVSETG